MPPSAIREAIKRMVRMILVLSKGPIDKLYQDVEGLNEIKDLEEETKRMSMRLASLAHRLYALNDQLNAIATEIIIGKSDSKKTQQKE